MRDADTEDGVGDTGEAVGVGDTGETDGDGDGEIPVRLNEVISIWPAESSPANTHPNPVVPVLVDNEHATTAHCGRRQSVLAAVNLAKASPAVWHVRGQVMGDEDGVEIGEDDGDDPALVVGDADGDGDTVGMKLGTHE